MKTQQNAAADCSPGRSNPVSRSGGHKTGTPFTPADWHRFAALLRLIRAGKGVCPSYTEIGAVWGVPSKSGVSRHMNTLRAAGLIDWLPAKARSIRVTQHLLPVLDSSGNTVFAAGA